MENFAFEVRQTDMTESMQGEMVEMIKLAFDSCTDEREIAGRIKKEADKKLSPTWHVIIGSNFSSSLNR
jgi:dynein light chain LC8-type